ncbi:sugar transporter domain-containing protein [Ditylenchus destructor]|uniref:Sugar transporter domain-containing protein n=1 Tax=Ditylenchus destructor TaxID=166010 RepID=A0AAD4QWJ8_9BILA|nr:sugar transporter domain-containing protein [Ditylenchus destructor]
MSNSQLNLFWSIVVSSIAVGALFGALLTQYMAEKFGRRNALIISGVFNVIGAFLEYFAKSLNSPEVLIIGRLILGGNIALSCGLVPMYLMEISPTRYRGAAGTAHQTAVAFSDWFAKFVGLPEILGGTNSWPIAYGFPGILALFLCIILPFCPKSPKFTLITKGQKSEAEKDLHRFMDKDEAERTLLALNKEAESIEATGTLKELFTTKELRYPLFISIWMMVAQTYTGSGAVFAYSTDMLVSAGMSAPVARWSTIGIGVAYFICACSATYLIERLGRRFLAIFQLGTVTIALSLISITAWLKSATQSVWLGYVTIALFLVYMCVYGVGSPIPWMISGEIFPTKFRPTAMTVTVFASFINSFLISLLYLPFKQAVGVSLSYLPFIIVSAISTVIVYFLLPETRNRTSKEITEGMASRKFSLIQDSPKRSNSSAFEETPLINRDNIQFNAYYSTINDK